MTEPTYLLDQQLKTSYSSSSLSKHHNLYDHKLPKESCQDFVGSYSKTSRTNPLERKTCTWW